VQLREASKAAQTMNSMLTALATHRGFIPYRLEKLPSGKSNKLPFDPDTGYNSDAQNPATWMTPDYAEAHARDWAPQFPDGTGVGIVIYEGSQLFCIDIDGCVTDAGYSDIAQQVIARFPGCVVEVSVSGTGLHIFGMYSGVMPPHAKKNAHWHMELYTAKRFIALTGRFLSDGWIGTNCTEALHAFAAEYFPKKDGDYAGEWTDKPADGWDFITDDDQLVNWCLTHANVAQRFGDKASFAALWAADAASLCQFFPSATGQDFDHSSADQALANHLAWVTGNDCERVARLMRRSALSHGRDHKWEREDYFNTTVAKACAGTKQWPTLTRAQPVPAGTPAAPGAGIVPVPPAPDEPAVTASVPEAKRLTTDQANAQRLQRNYRDQLIVCAGTFFAWTGTHWKINSGLARLLACNLSKIVEAEAEAVRAEAAVARLKVDPGALGMYEQDPGKHEDMLMRTPEGVAYLRMLDTIDALEKWTARCEMTATQDAALKQLKDLLTVDADRLDADPWAFNCLNGTVDLRTGKLRPHRAADLISKIAPTNFNPAAQCPRFLAFLAQIFDGDTSLVEFVQRFYGYAMTGLTKEQILLILWGEGGNGKTTLVEAIGDVIGDYASSAPTGLLTSKNATDNNHYAEIADLHGRRLVTASESEEGAKLKEAFIKKAVGGDTLKGRHLYGQLFEFKPSHTLQLLTNHKPQIRGNDFSVWRRVRLLPFLVKFGSAHEVRDGSAKLMKDTTLPAALLSEREGILAWLVEGARLWHASGALEAPEVVLAAGREYRHEQDRVGHFVNECCTVGKETDKTQVKAIYSAYMTWCREEGLDYPLTRRRLMDVLRLRVAAMGQSFKHKGEWCVRGIRIGSEDVMT
jgi:P4 family phage/plasmid primase-like protien